MKIRLPNLEARRAIATFGGFEAAKRKLKVTRSTLDQWLDGTRPLPIPRAYQIEKLTKGKHRCERLLPKYSAMFRYLRSTGSVKVANSPKEATEAM